MTFPEPTMIGVAEGTHAKLRRLKEDGHFKEMSDAYRFGIGLALAMGVMPPEISSQTVFSVATIDPDQLIKATIQALLDEQVRDRSIYRMAERLADWGINELYAQSERGEIDVVSIFDQLEAVRP